jgi:hypothetical protein
LFTATTLHVCAPCRHARPQLHENRAHLPSTCCPFLSRQWGLCSRTAPASTTTTTTPSPSPPPARPHKKRQENHRRQKGRKAERKKETAARHHLGRRASYGDAGRAGSSCRVPVWIRADDRTAAVRTGKACCWGLWDEQIVGCIGLVWGQCAQGPTGDKDVPTDAYVGVLLLAGRWVGAWSLVSQHGRPRPRGGGRVLS